MAKSLAQLIQEEEASAPKPERPSPSKELIPDKAQERREQFAWHYLFGSRPFDAGAAYKAVVPRSPSSRKHPNGKPTTDQHAWSQGARWCKDPTVQMTLARLVKESAARKQIDEDFVLGHWIAMSEANIYDYFEIQTEGEGAGHMVLRAKDAKVLSLMQQQNVRKLKVRNFSTTIKDVTTEEQTIELEIEHKKDAVKNLSVFLGMMKGKEGLDIEDLAQAIREGEQRALNRSVTIDNATGEVLK